MQQTKKPLFALALALWGFSSCSQDASDVQGSAVGGGETVTLSLRAEISVDDPSLRAIDYKLGTNAKGQLVPMPQFEDKQIVEVHTILKSSRSGSVPVAKTLKWRYDAAKKKLVLAPTNSDITQDENNIVISNFNTDGGTKLYISGLIGGTLSGTKVTFAGTRELQGASSAGDAVGSLEVPYAFPWTELTINTTDANNTRQSNGSYKYAQVPSTANLKFAPQGALIAYKLGNKQKAGAYTFTPSGFTVSTNAFGDQGTFELNTALPTQSTATVLPAWTEGTPSALVYSFADGEAPGTLEHESVASKTYYAWVMPHKTQPTSVITRVMIKGDSSRPANEGFKDYTKTWFTDYAPKASQLTQGRVHQLSANATHTYLLPIEYVTDYNLAGGDGLTYITTNFTNPQPAGVTGDLRFADSRLNDQSGYYNWYKVMGRQHATYNPQAKNLQTEVDKAFGADKYYVPVMDQWWGIFPSHSLSYLYWTGSQVLDRDEYMAFGPGHDLIRQSYRSDWSSSTSADNSTQDAYVYAIRFKSRPVAAPITQSWDYDASINTRKSYTYPSAPDNSLKCAYRYRRDGGATAWGNIASTNYNLTNQMIIDVVYLGEEAVPTTLAQISDNNWWSTKEAEGLVISKTFSPAGYIYNPSNSMSGPLNRRGDEIYCWSSIQATPSDAWNVYVNHSYLRSNHSNKLFNGLPVRLFARRNY